MLSHTKMATNPSEKHCRLASEGDALTILGQISDGFEKHEQAAAITPDPLFNGGTGSAYCGPEDRRNSQRRYKLIKQWA